jgi:hypothetical protein
MGGLGVSALAGFEVPLSATLLYVDTHLFLCIIPIVVVESNRLKAVYSCTAPIRGFDQCSSKRLFLCLFTQPPMCRGQHDRHGGQVTTVGKRERVTGAAKIEPLRERLSGMCGSVQH